MNYNKSFLSSQVMVQLFLVIVVIVLILLTYNIIVGYALTLKCVATAVKRVQSTFATFIGLL